MRGRRLVRKTGATLAIAAVLAAGASPAKASDAWGTRAAAVCRDAFRTMAPLIDKGPGSTRASAARWAAQVEPLEAMELSKLRAITARRSAADSRALTALARDLSEVRRALANRTHPSVFDRWFTIWIKDGRTSSSFKQAGVRACAGPGPSA
jgi:hypothetical protein